MFFKPATFALLALVASASPIAPAPGANEGVATYYYQNGRAGSCGATHSDNDRIVAISENAYKISDYCGRKVSIKNTGGGHYNSGVGRTVTATVADSCAACDANHLDLSTGLWSYLHGANDMQQDGIFNIEWYFE